MPGLVVFNRRWGIASDDFVFPGLFELFIRILWYVNQCVLINSFIQLHNVEGRNNFTICVVFILGGLAP